MKIIGSGFGRTGTLSLKAALEILGFAPCYHMQTVIKQPRHIKLWQKIAYGELVPWDTIFAGYQAAVDFPASIFYQELLAQYPHAKIIHTVRDPDRWYSSTEETIFRFANNFPTWLQFFIRPLHNFADMQQRLIWDGLFDGRFQDRNYAIHIFNQATENVQQHVPPEKLLIFQVKEGWEPLCAFLNVPIPDVPFPHVNDRATMQRHMKRVRATATAGLLAAALVAILGLHKRLQNR